MSKISTFEERLQKAYEAVEEMNKKDKAGLSIIDVMKPLQWLNNLLTLKHQMEKEKYFTPDIEDIRVGYECETKLVTLYPNGKTPESIEEYLEERWNKSILDWYEVHDIMFHYNKNKLDVRVPYLTEDKIEGEGWNFQSYFIFIANLNEEGKDEEIRIAKKGNYKLSYNFYTHKLKIAEHNSEEPILFNGECKDINTFRMICKLLKIN